MSRRRTAEKREIQPDPKFGEVRVSKFINCLMYEGKKSVTESIVYGAFEQIQKKSGNDPVKVFHDALGNVKPQLEARSRRVGGATYQGPVGVGPGRGPARGIRWFINTAGERSESTMVDRLSGELLDASNNRG